MNAHNLDALRDLGISVSELGCVMLDVDAPVRVSDDVRVQIADVLPEAWGYTSANPALPHVSGIQHEHHVTLLYGLLPSVRRAHVDEVLTGWDGLDVAIKTDCLDVFESPLPDEPYSCIVARQSWVAGNDILDAHQRLSLLPHIDTNPVFKTHITLAYVHRERTQDALVELQHAFDPDDFGMTGVKFQPLALNYGDKIGD